MNTELQQAQWKYRTALGELGRAKGLVDYWRHNNYISLSIAHDMMIELDYTIEQERRLFKLAQRHYPKKKPLTKAQKKEQAEQLAKQQTEDWIPF